MTKATSVLGIKLEEACSYLDKVTESTPTTLMINLVNAIADAIEMSEKIDGVKVVDKAEAKVEEKLDFATVRAEAADLWAKLVEQNEENANIILKKIEIIMGHKMRLSEFTEDQVDLLNLAVNEMRDML